MFFDYTSSTKTKKTFTSSQSIKISKNRLCEGGDLLSTISTFRKLKQKDVAHIMKQILAAVKFCHSKHIIHRFI